MLAPLRRTSTTDFTLESTISGIATRDSVSSSRSEFRRASLSKSFFGLPPKPGSSSKLVRSGAHKNGKNDPESNPSSARSLGEIFFSLPNEMQLHILSEVSIHDILNCRAANHAFNHVVNINQSMIARSFINFRFPAYCSMLYAPTKFDLKSLIRMVHRLTISEKLAETVADYIALEIMRIHSKTKRKEFEGDWYRMKKKMTPLIFTLYHFFETWRERVLVLPHNSLTTFNSDSNIVSELLGSYDWDVLLASEHMYGLLRQTTARQLRPPTYANGVERAFRGWSAKPPPIADIQIAIAIGGLDIVQQILSRKTYAERIKTLDSFLKKIVPTQSIKWQSNLQSVVYGPYAEQELQVRPTWLHFLTTMKDEYSPYPWGGSARLLEMGIIRDANEIKKPRQFISELLGYDVLTRRAFLSTGAEADLGSENNEVLEGDAGGPADDDRGYASVANWWE